MAAREPDHDDSSPAAGEAERSAQRFDEVLLTLIERAQSFVDVVTPEGLLVVPRGWHRLPTAASIFDLVAPESHQVTREALRLVDTTGEAVWYEATYRAEEDLPARVFRIRAVPLGQTAGAKAIALLPADITDRVRLERALIESEQTLRLAVDATRIGLWRWDVAQNRVEWDKRLLEIWGLTETPPTYEHYRAYLHPDDRPRVEAAIAQALATGVYPTLEHRLRPADGSDERHVLAVGTVVKGADGKPARLMGGLLDISDQKRLEKHMASAARVEAIGQLTGGIAHNFNNLLSIIIPNVELSLASAPTEDDRAQLAAALEAALQARGVVKSRLELSRRRSPDEASPAARPAEVVRRVVAMCRSTFPREIEVLSTVAEGLGVVPMSSSDLEQVVLNLLVNARDAVEGLSRPARLSVAVDRQQLSGNSWARVRVSDNGSGMTDEVRARLFEPFFTTKPLHRGTGLGLANVLMRVQAAGGKVQCQSTVGEGTTFEILLPEQPTAAEPAPQPAPSATAAEVILVVDDEPVVRGAVRRVLERAGYAVIEAGSAAEARARLGGDGPPVKLVILDHSMPGESGTTALPSLRELTPSPIILFSGMLLERPQGVHAVLEKPARPEELVRTVKHALNG